MAEPVLAAMGGAACEKQSWSPEILSFFGDPETVINKLGAVEADLSDRRVFVLTLQTNDSAEIALYERTRPGRVTISRWKGAPSEDFQSQVNETIIANKGVHCVGEQTKAIVSRLPNVQTETDVAAPANAKAAFSHQIRAQGKDYLGASVIILC